VALNIRAVELYERVLRDGPPQYLAQSARLGLARAALAAGDESRARATLRDVIQDKGAHPRDKLVASQILGNYYHNKGMFREAIEAYDGGVSQ
jgi:Tfp pilus assembly protein PilF